MAKAARPAAKKRTAKPSEAATAERIMTTAQVAELFEITAERVRQLVKSGHIEKNGKDQVPLVPAVRGYIRFLKEDERRSSKTASASRVHDARAKEIELKTAEREGRLMDVDEVREVVGEWAGKLRTGFAGIPARLSRDLTFRRQIEAEIDDVFRKATDHFEKAMGDRRAADSAAEADAGDDA